MSTTAAAMHPWRTAARRRLGVGLGTALVVLLAGACAGTDATPQAALVPVEVPAPPASPGAAADPTTADPTTADPAASDPATTAPAPRPSEPDPAALTPPRADISAPGWLPVAPDEDMPNPMVLWDDATDHYILFATQNDFFGDLLNVPWRASRDLVTWHHPGDALPDLPPWAGEGATWAPDVMEVDGGWVLYFTARTLDSGGREGIKCIGHAVADTLTGPYRAFDEPIVCQVDRGGSIDPRTFIDDDGSRWLLWKSDDNSDLRRRDLTAIYVQRLSDDGTRLLDAPTVLFEAAYGWEGHIVEAPDLVRGPDGRLWLFYSGGWFNQPSYGIGVAECLTIAGPCERLGAGPWLGSNAQGRGPGEASLFEDTDGSLWLAYSPWAQDGPRSTPRPLAVARVGFDATGPYLGDPSR